jgi:hypothetical protein
MLFLLILLQAQAPDMQLNGNVRAKSVTIEKRGNVSLNVVTSPDGGNLVDVRASKGVAAKELRNVEVNVRAEARIGDPVAAPENNPPRPETSQPQ